MSLKREEWEDIWYQMRLLECMIAKLPPAYEKRAEKCIQFVKDKVQSVIGQME